MAVSMQTQNQDVQNQVDSKKEFGRGAKAVYKRWCSELELAEREEDDWRERAVKIVRRYKDEQFQVNEYRQERYNILWANVEILKPALYSATPKPRVIRRFRDDDQLARVASEILERATTYCLDSYNFDDCIRNAVCDLLVVGRGTAWIRYIPTFERRVDRVPIYSVVDESGAVVEYQTLDGGQITDDVQLLEDDEGLYFEDEYEELSYEQVVSDYVHWSDFLTSPARRWEEVRWVARKAYLTREQLKRRFGAKAKDVVLDHNPSGMDSGEGDLTPKNEQFGRAVVYEIWNKEDRKVYWIAKGYDKGPLDEKEDPLGLKDFFPCPKPLYAATSTDSLIPAPDFAMYQTQAQELDDLTVRIIRLTDTLRTSGCYDASLGMAMSQMMQSDGKLIPVEDKDPNQRLDDSIWFVPIERSAQVLNTLIQIRQVHIRDLDQLSGIPDLMRGQQAAKTSAAATNAKSQFVGLRMKERQADVQRFARDLIALKAEVIAEKFQAETIALMANVQAKNNAELQQGFPQVVEFLRRDSARRFKIDVETDSTLALDEQQEKQQRIELLRSLSQFLGTTQQVAQSMPLFGPVMGELLMYTIRAFGNTRNVEASLQQAVDVSTQRMIERMKNPPKPQPDPDLLKIEADKEKAQVKAQLDQAKLEYKKEIDSLRELVKTQVEEARLEYEREKLLLKTETEETKLEIERLKLLIESAQGMSKEKDLLRE